MKNTYIGTKIVQAEPAYKSGEKIYLKTEDLYNSFKEDDLIADGYAITYNDGYTSWSPKEVFEKAYKQSGDLSFGDAIYYLKLGYKVTRKGWNGKGIHLELQVPDRYSKMTSPYIFIDTTGLETSNPNSPKSRVPWLASQTDMLSEDWCIYE